MHRPISNDTKTHKKVLSKYLTKNEKDVQRNIETVNHNPKIQHHNNVERVNVNLYEVNTDSISSCFPIK